MMNTGKQQQGIALVTVLVLMVMLVLVAVVSMRTASVDLRIAKNTRDKSVAFRVSSDVATQMDDILADHMFYRGWDGFTIPSEFSASDATSRLYEGDVENPFDFTSTSIDLGYDSGHFDADIFVSRIRSALATGAGAALGEGYSGLGRGAAGGGGSIFFDVSARGRFNQGTSSANSITGGYRRLTIRN